MKPDELANRFLDASAAFVAYVERLGDQAWRTYVPNEGRTVAALVHHVAWAYQAESQAFLEIANGRTDTGWTAEWLEAQNAEQGERFAQADRATTLAELCQAAEVARTMIAGLGEDQLARRGRHMPGEPERSVAEWIEVCLIGHAAEHQPSIERAVSGERDGN